MVALPIRRTAAEKSKQSLFVLILPKVLICGDRSCFTCVEVQALRLVSRSFKTLEDARICPSIEAQFLRIQCKPSEPLQEDLFHVR